MGLPTKSIYWVGTAMVVAVLTYVAAQVFLRNPGVHSVFGVGPKIVNAASRIERLPHTEDYGAGDTISISPDDRWLVYGANGRLVFYRIGDQKKFEVTQDQLIAAGRTLAGPDADAIGNLASYWGPGDRPTTWSADGQRYYYYGVDMGSGYTLDPISFEKTYTTTFATIEFTQGSPKVTWQTAPIEGWTRPFESREYPNPNRYIKQHYRLTCADCDHRDLLLERWQSIQPQLPESQRWDPPRNAWGEPYLQDDRWITFAVSTQGVYYYPVPEGRGFRLMAKDTKTNEEKRLAYIELEDLERSRTTKLIDLGLTPDEKKLGLVASNMNFGGYSAGYILDLSEQRPILYYLGKYIYERIYWNRASNTAYFGCPPDDEKNKSGQAYDRLCSLTLIP